MVPSKIKKNTTKLKKGSRTARIGETGPSDTRSPKQFAGQERGFYGKPGNDYTKRKKTVTAKRPKVAKRTTVSSGTKVSR
jgi:hypothetical protein